MSPLRRVAVVTLWAVAAGLLVILLGTAFGLASEYGSGAGDLAAFAVVPLVVAIVAAETSFTAWRAALLATGWKVVRDDTEVVVHQDGVRLTLFVQDGLSMLNATSDDAGACDDGRSASYDSGRVGPC